MDDGCLERTVRGSQATTACGFSCTIRCRVMAVGRASTRTVLENAHLASHADSQWPIDVEQMHPNLRSESLF